MKNTDSFKSRSLGAVACIAATAAIGLVAPASAMTTLSTQDATFVNKAAQGGMAEVAAGTLAESKSTNPAVKQFAMKMVSDHTKNNMKLASIAKMKGVVLPSSIGAENMKMKGALESVHGVAFDTTYMQGQKAGHMKMATVMKQEIAQGKDADLVSFAKMTLPAVEAHLMLDEHDLSMMSKSSMKGMKGM